MHSVSLTHEQAVAIGQLARDDDASRVDVTNPSGLGFSTVFVSTYLADESMRQHAIDFNGFVSTTATVAA